MHRRHEVGVVDGQCDGLALAVQGVGLFDDLFFDLQVAAFAFEGEGGAEDAQGVGVGVHGAGDVGTDAAVAALGEGFAQDGFAGAGRTGDQAEAALVAVHAEVFEDVLLAFEQGLLVVAEGCVGDAEVGLDHGDLRMRDG